MNKCHEVGLKLNPDKCVFGETSVKFYGNTFSKEGLRPDPAKFDIILKMPTPTKKTELASFLGMCNYLSPYISHLSDVTASLRQLIKKTAEFRWDITYNKVFKQAKLHVANAATLKYFDPLKPIVLECDASGTVTGWSACHIHFQALTDTQKRYSNIECELLAVVVIIEHLHHYIFGHQFTVHTDHLPLVNLIQKCLNDTSPCLQRLLLRLRC